jgi:hypothetical protein
VLSTNLNRFSWLPIFCLKNFITSTPDGSAVSVIVESFIGASLAQENTDRRTIAPAKTLLRSIVLTSAIIFAFGSPSEKPHISPQ